jgi:ribulose 1,5-bisphosphate synthetase/thiazole synthase
MLSKIANEMLDQMDVRIVGAVGVGLGPAQRFARTGLKICLLKGNGQMKRI